MPNERTLPQDGLAALSGGTRTQPMWPIPDSRPPPQPTRQSRSLFGLSGRGLNAGIGGGIVMMVVAVVWFVVGLHAHLIFFYPPILFVIGAGAFLKGLFRDNG